MLEVYDKQRRLVGILQNAYNLSEELKINAVNYFSFSLPYNDPKNEYCQPYSYIRYNKGELYRILPAQTTINELGDTQYKCEHVLALLIDNVLFGDHIVGNRGYFTRNVIQYILDFQLEKNWVLGECDFNREFEYGWTGETLLSALFSIPQPFVDKYIWTFNTNNYPFVLNLKRINENINPEMYIRAKKNLLQLIQTNDPTNICTRLYPLGEGEGVNQLNIKSLTGGKPYIQSPQQFIDKYGIIERIWIDRRYTHAESLYDAAVSMLNELQEPFEEYQVEFAILGEDSYDIPALGKLVEVVGFKRTYITGITYKYDEITSSTLTIANKPKDVASTIADMQDRQRIEMAYSQGATQFYQDHVYDNADPNTPLSLKLMIPSSIKIINSIKVDVEIGPFRKPFTVTGGGGGQTISQSNTTSSGASSTTTTASGGGQTSGSSSLNTTNSDGYTSTSTSSGGGDTSGPSDKYTSDTGGGGETPATSYGVLWRSGPMSDTSGDFAIGMPIGNSGEVNNHFHKFNNLHSHRVDAHTHGMQHTHKIYAHSHNFTINNHSHGMAHTHNIYSHTHDMPHYHSIAHTHSIPDHVHSLKPGISFEGNPSSFDLIINGVKQATIIGLNLQTEISTYLLNSKNIIPRDTYHKIEIVPNDTSYVMLTVNVQGFIQSRGDKTY